jgi:YD repeat-containing protein
MAGRSFSQQSETITYTYDKLNRLTGVIYSSGTSIIYTYDAAGNRTLVQVTGASTNPVIININPSSAAAGAAGFILTVNGNNFFNNSVVQWNGADRATTFVSSSQLTASIPASDLAASGTANIAVINPGGLTSNAVAFPITNGTPTPTPLPTPTPSSQPVLLSEEASDKAITLDSVTSLRSPFSINTQRNFSSDQISRVTLLALLPLTPGETISIGDVTVQAEDDNKVIYFPAVEFVGRVPNFEWLISVNFKLPSEFKREGNMWVSIKFRGATSNKVRVPISNNPTREFVSFVEGNPGAPGDGISISASGGTNPFAFDFTPLISLKGPTDGYTFTVFLPPSEPSLYSLSFNIVSLRGPGPCETSFGAGGGFVTGRVTLNGVQGAFVNVPQYQLNSFVESANIFNPGCGFTINDIYIGKMYLYRDHSGGPNISVLDAVAVGQGQNNFPGTRVP